MFFLSNKKAQSEKERKAREVANLKQGFFQLPQELRNQIYEMVIPSNREIVKRPVYPRSRGWQGGVPPLLHVCRGLREEVFPIFYGTNTVTIVLEDLIMHPRSANRMRSSVNLLPKQGTTCWRKVKIESCGRCFHDGFARQPPVNAVLNRDESTIACQPRYSRLLKPCCHAAAQKYSKRLSSQIEAHGLHQGETKLRREDFERLMRRMDENRKDWPMSPKRVIPRYLSN